MIRFAIARRSEYMGLGMKYFVPESDEERGTLVFLLGAGCSADGGSPVMRDFMAKARGCDSGSFCCKAQPRS